MLRHFFLFAPAPGRHDEAERALRDWLAAVRSVSQLQGAAVLRGRAGEFGDLPPLLALTFDVASPADGLAFKEASKAVPNPMAEDIPGRDRADQGAVLFAASDQPHGRSRPGRSDGNDGHDQSRSDPVPDLEFDRGDGLLARLLRVHFEVLEEALPTKAATAKGPVG